MNRPLAAFAATAALVGTALAGTALAIPSAASASALAPVRTYTGAGSVTLTGLHASSWWHYDSSQTYTVMLSPRFEVSVGYRLSDFNKSQPETTSGHYDEFGRTLYRQSGSGTWQRITVSNATLRAVIAGSSPEVTQADFLALPGVHEVGPREYQMTGGGAQVDSYLKTEFSLPAAGVSGNGIKNVTITLWDGPAGRPVKLTATGQSSTTRLRAQETFANYNQPVTIHAPA
jgi:hypothetical protein